MNYRSIRAALGRRSRVFVVVLLAISALAIAPLAAHSEVFATAPLVGQPIGGVVDQVEISFWTPVLSSQITLADPNGDEVEVSTTTLSADDRIATVTFPELTEPGQYVVTHGELSFDGDLQNAQWFFVYEPTAEARLVQLSSGGDGPNWIVLAGASGVILILAGLLWPRKKTATADA